MLPAAVLVVLLAAFVFLRMWDAARDASLEDPAAPDAGPPPDVPATPAPPGVRVAAIVVSLVLGSLSYIALPALLDALLGDGGDSTPDTWTLCRTAAGDGNGPEGTLTLWPGDHHCE